MPDAEPTTTTEPKASTGTSLMDGATDIASDSWIHEHEFGEGVAKRVHKFDGVPAMGKGYADLETQMGTMIAGPKEGDTDEQAAAKVEKVAALFGKPEKAEDYVMEKPEEAPEGMAWSDEAATSFKELAHNLGLNQAKFEQALKWEVGRLVIARQAKAAVDADAAAVKDKQAEESVVELKSYWGNDGYDASLSNSLDALRKYGGDDTVKLFQDKGIDNHPLVLKMFREIHTVKMAEDKLVVGDGAGPAPEGGWKAFYANPKPKG